MVEGIGQEAWQEVTDVFGNGQDYAYALEEDEVVEEEKELKDVSGYAWRPECVLSCTALTRLDLLRRSSSLPRLPRAC